MTRLFCVALHGCFLALLGKMVVVGGGDLGNGKRELNGYSNRSKTS